MVKAMLCSLRTLLGPEVLKKKKVMKRSCFSAVCPFDNSFPGSLSQVLMTSIRRFVYGSVHLRALA